MIYCLRGKRILETLFVLYWKVPHLSHGLTISVNEPDSISESCSNRVAIANRSHRSPTLPVEFVCSSSAKSEPQNSGQRQCSSSERRQCPLPANAKPSVSPRTGSRDLHEKKGFAKVTEGQNTKTFSVAHLQTL